LIDRLFPADVKPDWLELERFDHENFIANRAAVNIPRPHYFERLVGHAAEGRAPLVVVGESGIGKSALLANWVLHHRREHPEDVVLAHFVGVSPGSGGWCGCSSG
jgi:hypothetical protein